jgi:hypothetical protein
MPPCADMCLDLFVVVLVILATNCAMRSDRWQMKSIICWMGYQFSK